MSGKYPDIEDEEFYEKINTIYKRFTIPRRKKTLEEICFPKKFQLQLPQEFLAEYLSPRTPWTSMLVYHRIGAGKTCTAIRIAEKWKRLRRILVVVPASLKGNFRSELRSRCADDDYLKPAERTRLAQLHPSDPEYREIIQRSDERIDKVYEIYSYNKFVQLSQDNQINLRNSVLIIDEIQNMVSEEGTYYATLYRMIHDAPADLRIVLLSATPMFDKPNEIALTMNLLRIPQELPTGRDFYKTFVRIIKRPDGKYYYKTKNMDYFKQCIRGYVSYFRGAPPYAFPQLVVRYVKVEMSDFQYQAYKDVIRSEEAKYKRRKSKDIDPRDLGAIKALTVKNLPNNFFIGTRIVSNIVFPNRKINEEGFRSFKGESATTDLEIYSPKFARIIRKIGNARGKVFVYSSFKEYGGIKSLTRALDENGYKNYIPHGEGPKRYAVWSGDEDIRTKDEIRAVYNHPNNLYGKSVKVLLGSPSIREGVSLTAVQQVHVLEPYWNQARLDQVIGRASRFCSHKDVPEERRIVKVYIYIAVREEEPQTVDEYIWNLAVQKNKLVREFERSLKEVAIDCEINKNANVYEGEDDITCET